MSTWHEFTGAEPCVAFRVSKNVVSLTHFDAWRYGTNFVNIDFLLSDNRDPQYPWGRARADLAEFETDNRLTLDIGKLVADRLNLFDAFVGYRFWLNKFGSTPYPANSPPLSGTVESTFYLGVAWHVF